MKKSINDLTDVKGKRALVRVDVNVPLDADKNVTDDTRIQAIVPTVRALQEKGAKIILMAHLGRPKGEWNPEFTLEPVAKHMSKVLGEDVLFVKSPVGEGADKELEALKDGQVALLENIRYYKAEEAKDDDMTFAEELAKLGDFYVNDAFGAAHRKHTSTAKVAQLVLCPVLEASVLEVDELDETDRGANGYGSTGSMIKEEKQFRYNSQGAVETKDTVLGKTTIDTKCSTGCDHCNGCH